MIQEVQMRLNALTRLPRRCVPMPHATRPRVHTALAVPMLLLVALALGACSYLPETSGGPNAVCGALAMPSTTSADSGTPAATANGAVTPATPPSSAAAAAPAATPTASPTGPA